MAPIKFEDNIKEKLEERRLTPNDSSWAALQNQLEANASKKNRKPFWWMGLAASFIGILLVSTLFFNKENNLVVPIKVVDVEVENPIETNKIDATKVTQEKKNLIAIPKKTEIIERNNSVSNKKKLKTQLSKKENQLQLEKLKIKNTTIAKKVINEEVSPATIETLSLEEQQINAVVAEINKLNKSTHTLGIDSEVDVLLQEAQRDIAFNKLYKQAIKTVDANGLLLEAEEDLQESFREKVFSKILEGLKDVKRAYVNRNN